MYISVEETTICLGVFCKFGSENLEILQNLYFYLAKKLHIGLLLKLAYKLSFVLASQAPLGKIQCLKYLHVPTTPGQITRSLVLFSVKALVRVMLAHMIPECGFVLLYGLLIEHDFKVILTNIGYLMLNVRSKMMDLKSIIVPLLSQHVVYQEIMNDSYAPRPPLLLLDVDSLRPYLNVSLGRKHTGETPRIMSSLLSLVEGRRVAVGME